MSSTTLAGVRGLDSVLAGERHLGDDRREWLEAPDNRVRAASTASCWRAMCWRHMLGFFWGRGRSGQASDGAVQAFGGDLTMKWGTVGRGRRYGSSPSTRSGLAAIQGQGEWITTEPSSELCRGHGLQVQGPIILGVER